MSNSWYEDVISPILVTGSLMVLTVLGLRGALTIYLDWQQSQIVNVAPQFSGRIIQPVGEAPNLQVIVWHHHAGNLNNGHLKVSVEGELADRSRGRETQLHSFELWEPNPENAVVFNFPLKRFDPDVEIPVTVLVTGKKIEMCVRTAPWLGDDWKSNQEAEANIATD